MKRSEINQALKELEAMCKEYKCYLPSFCNSLRSSGRILGRNRKQRIFLLPEARRRYQVSDYF